jgi:hypothetical protein
LPVRIPICVPNFIHVNFEGPGLENIGTSEGHLGIFSAFGIEYQEK